jgi:hypothetical protein
VRSALQRSGNALGRGGPGNPFARRALAAVELAIEEANAAIAFVEAHPEMAALPAVPPKTVPAFEPPARERGRYPGRQIPLNNLKDAFERLAAQPGGDLGGSRTRIYEAIATASRETIADIVVTARGDDLRRIAASLQRTTGSLVRAGPAGSVHAQRAAVSIQSALDGIHGAIAFIRGHPHEAMGEPPAAVATIESAGSAPSTGGSRYAGREAAILGLGEAYASIASLPGGDYGGLRSRIQSEIRAAYSETLADLHAAAERERERESAPVPPIDGLRFQ